VLLPVGPGPEPVSDGGRPDGGGARQHATEPPRRAAHQRPGGHVGRGGPGGRRGVPLLLPRQGWTRPRPPADRPQAAGLRGAQPVQDDLLNALTERRHSVNPLPAAFAPPPPRGSASGGTAPGTRAPAATAPRGGTSPRSAPPARPAR